MSEQVCTCLCVYVGVWCNKQTNNLKEASSELEIKQEQELIEQK